MTDETRSKVAEAVEEIARFDDAARLARSPFHLSPCGGCGCPCFRQPCSLCGHYPMGETAPTGLRATPERFAAMVDRSGPGGKHGTIATWHARSRFETAAWAYRPDKDPASDAAAALAAASPMPTADEVWHVVSERRETISRRIPDEATIRGWNGLEQLRTVVSKDADRLAPAVVREMTETMNEWCRSAHSEDASAMRGALDAASSLGNRVRGLVTLRGNLEYALAAIEEAASKITPSPSP